MFSYVSCIIVIINIVSLVAIVYFFVYRLWLRGLRVFRGFVVVFLYGILVIVSSKIVLIVL